MKYAAAVLIAAVFFSSVSCVSQIRRNSLRDFPEAPAFYGFAAGTVSITVDHVDETELSGQLWRICNSILRSARNYDIPPEEIFTVDITISQRNFIRNLELYNAIYVNCSVKDRDGKEVAEEVEYISTRSTIAAAAEQHAIMQRILGRLLDSQKARYKEIAKNRKQA